MWQTLKATAIHDVQNTPLFYISLDSSISCIGREVGSPDVSFVIYGPLFKKLSLRFLKGFILKMFCLIYGRNPEWTHSYHTLRLLL